MSDHCPHCGTECAEEKAALLRRIPPQEAERLNRCPCTDGISYRLSFTGRSSQQFGPCEVCREHAAEVYIRTDYECRGGRRLHRRSAFGHRACLVETEAEATQCYACDRPATGTRNRTHEAERRKVPACCRHRDDAERDPDTCGCRFCRAERGRRAAERGETRRGSARAHAAGSEVEALR